MIWSSSRLATLCQQISGKLRFHMCLSYRNRLTPCRLLEAVNFETDEALLTGGMHNIPYMLPRNGDLSASTPGSNPNASRYVTKGSFRCATLQTPCNPLTFYFKTNADSVYVQSHYRSKRMPRRHSITTLDRETASMSPTVPRLLRKAVPAALYSLLV